MNREKREGNSLVRQLIFVTPTEIPAHQIFLFPKEVKNLFDDTRRRLVDIELAVNELVINSFEHGNKLNTAKKVTIDIKVARNEIKVSVTDEGSGYSDSLAAQLNSSPYDRPPVSRKSNPGRGNGTFMLRKLYQDGYITELYVSGNKVSLVLRN